MCWEDGTLIKACAFIHGFYGICTDFPSTVCWGEDGTLPLGGNLRKESSFVVKKVLIIRVIRTIVVEKSIFDLDFLDI